MEKKELLTEKPKSREKSTLSIIKSTSQTIRAAEVLVTGSNAKTPSPLNFDVFMPWVCKQFQVDVAIESRNVAQTQTLHSHSMKFKKRKKSEVSAVDEDAGAAVTPTDGKDKSAKSSSSAFMGSVINNSYKAIQILATYDPHHNLEKINLHDNKEIPRDLLIILSLIVKFYPALTTLTMNSGINMYSIYEISKLLTKSALKEIYLDGTRIKNPNYHILLETANCLNCLSLARCQIGDEVVKRITDLLAFPLPASRTLTFLDLSSNKITDKGAGYLAAALRTNRQLACLNLTGNHINDTGASYVFDILLQFPITEEEMVQSKLRRLKYMKQKTVLVGRFMAELKTAEELKTVKKRTVAIGTKSTRKNSLETREPMRDIRTLGIPDRKYSVKAESLATKTLGEYKDPFQFPASFIKNGNLFCIGNTALASLNLSYNNLSYVTLKKLLKVLNYQKHIMQKPRGLFRVRIEGNYCPLICEEYTEINEMLNSSIDFHQPVAKKKAVVK